MTQEEPPTAKLRLVLLTAFGGLLALVLVAGIGALRVLRELHAEEEHVRETMLAGGQSLTTLCTSLDVYQDRIQRMILYPERSGDAARDLAQVDTAIDSLLKTFPQIQEPEEKELVDTMERLFAEQRAMLRSILTWSPDERRRKGPRMLVEEMLPGGERIQQTYERVTVYNSRQVGAYEHELLARFEALQGSLGRLLLVSLGAGLVLSLASGFYVLKLERQGRRRYAELAGSRSELERLSARLVDAQETERRTISRELHDEVGQLLGAALVDIGRLSAMVPENNAAAREYLGKIKSTTEKTVGMVRDIALLLRPSMLDDLGLVAALEWQGREVSRRGEMEVEVEAGNVSDQLPDEHKICVYRLVQEALNNAARHAGARNARVKVEQKDGGIEIEVRDDGHGFDLERARGLGILGMEERVRRLGGWLSIESQPGKGSVVRARLPLGAAA